MVATPFDQPVTLQILSASARKIVATTTAPKIISSSVRRCQASKTKRGQTEDDQHPADELVLAAVSRLARHQAAGQLSRICTNRVSQALVWCPSTTRWSMVSVT